MKHFYTIELNGKVKQLHCGTIRLFITAFRLLAGNHSGDWRISIRTLYKDNLKGSCHEKRQQDEADRNP